MVTTTRQTTSGGRFSHIGLGALVDSHSGSARTSSKSRRKSKLPVFTWEAYEQLVSTKTEDNPYPKADFRIDESAARTCLMALSARQRHIRRSVEVLKRDVIADQFFYWPDSMAFDTDDKFVGGRHRCTAVIKACEEVRAGVYAEVLPDLRPEDIFIEVLITVGLPPAVLAVGNQGAPQTTVESGQHYGVKASAKAYSTARLMLCGLDHRIKWGKREQVTYYLRHRHHIDYALKLLSPTNYEGYQHDCFADNPTTAAILARARKCGAAKVRCEEFADLAAGVPIVSNSHKNSKRLKSMANFIMRFSNWRKLKQYDSQVGWMYAALDSALYAFLNGNEVPAFPAKLESRNMPTKLSRKAAALLGVTDPNNLTGTYVERFPVNNWDRKIVA